MSELIGLERRRTSMRGYRFASGLLFLFLLGMLCLFAAVPSMEPGEAKEELFCSFAGLGTMNNVLSTAAFTILSAVMASKVVIEEYSGKRAILLFAYPVSRRKILAAKLTLVYGYSMLSMAVCAGAAFLLFCLGAFLVPLEAGRPVTADFLYTGVSLLCDIVTAGALGIVALWIGFCRKSVSSAVVAAVILASAACQLTAVSFQTPMAALLLTVLAGGAAVLALRGLFFKIVHIEV